MSTVNNEPAVDETETTIVDEANVTEVVEQEINENDNIAQEEVPEETVAESEEATDNEAETLELEYDEHGNAMIGGVRFYSQSSLDNITQKATTENKRLKFFNDLIKDGVPRANAELLSQSVEVSKIEEFDSTPFVVETASNNMQVVKKVVRQGGTVAPKTNEVVKTKSIIELAQELIDNK